jgi:hypothetical protein
MLTLVIGFPRSGRGCFTFRVQAQACRLQAYDMSVLSGKNCANLTRLIHIPKQDLSYAQNQYKNNLNLDFTSSRLPHPRCLIPGRNIRVSDNQILCSFS